MNTPVTAILDGLSVAGMQWRLVLGILLVLAASQGILLFLLYRLFGSTFHAEEYIALSLGGWLLPASILSLLWYMAAGLVSPRFSSLVIAASLAAGVILLIRSYKEPRASSRVALCLLLLAGLFLLLRLAFVSRALYPLYFDSAQHYRFIHELLARLEAAGAPGSPPGGYYHLGFHFLAAFITSITGAEITETMLVLGQVILALMPFTVFFIVKHASGSSTAAFLALVMAAFGWYMPAHAMDWGKYPALASLALIPFVPGLAYLSIQHRKMLRRRRYLALNILLLAATLISIFFHSRSLVVYALLAIAWLLTLGWNRMGRKTQLLILGLFILILVGEIIHIRTQSVLGPLLDAYGSDAFLLTIPVLVLSVFAWRSFPGLVFFCLVTVTLVLASLFVSLGDLIPGYTGTTLLDRPYVQMLLYLPLTLLAGFGLAGLEQMLAGRSLAWKNSQMELGKLIGGMLILLVTIHALFQYDLYPSDCCAIVSPDDVEAIDWLDQNLPVDALILTSSTDLKVLPTEEYQGSAGGDAGTWITALTGRPVTFLPYNTDFSQRQTWELLCRQNVGYVYAGKTGWYFDDAGMAGQLGGFRLLLNLPKARVYQVIGCE